MDNSQRDFLNLVLFFFFNGKFMPRSNEYSYHAHTFEISLIISRKTQFQYLTAEIQTIFYWLTEVASKRRQTIAITTMKDFRSF